MGGNCSPPSAVDFPFRAVPAAPPARENQLGLIWRLSSRSGVGEGRCSHCSAVGEAMVAGGTLYFVTTASVARRKSKVKSVKHQPRSFPTVVATSTQPQSRAPPATLGCYRSYSA